jgi:hypothetical protein
MRRGAKRVYAGTRQPLPHSDRWNKVVENAKVTLNLNN